MKKTDHPLETQTQKSAPNLDHLQIPKKILEAETIIPQSVIIETVFGCNASCTMCPIDLPTDRTKGIISSTLFEKIIDDLEPYKESIRQLDLFGVGEPLLDPNYPAKIAYAKNKGFTNVGFATNADLLTSEKAMAVLEAGIDTIMLSIDGMSKETHESIRKKTDFDNVVKNTRNAIRLRDQNGHSTKFVLRFIRQDNNIHEWDDYCTYWKAIIDEAKGDLIVGYDLHSWGGEIETPQDDTPAVPADLPCHHLFDRMTILKDGRVSICCADMHLAEHIVGDCTNTSPIEVFNSKAMNGYRDLHCSGNRFQMKICKACTILNSEAHKDKLEHEG